MATTTAANATTVDIAIIGATGRVGRRLLDLLERQRATLHAGAPRLRVVAAANSRAFLAVPEQTPPARIADLLAASAVPADPLALARAPLHPRIVVDCTASADIAKRYPDWLAAGIHVITPNKKANSADLPFYRRLREARRTGAAHYLYETTVGAGLPVVQTLRDLRETGDEITSVEGIFSGTLAYIFNTYDGRKSFSDIVRDARQRGYTEPDPRDDLSGMDVARKLIILGREMGLDLEMADVEVESLVPAGLETGSIEDFMARLPQHDASMNDRLQTARSRGKVLRYVGRLTADGKATVGVVELDARHAFANIALTDNVVRFATRRYCDNPLIVQGPGAGPEVTAGGVFADLLRLAAYLGARL